MPNVIEFSPVNLKIKKYKGERMSISIDKKISPLDLEQKGLCVDGVEILPPIKKKTQEQLRACRKIPYLKIAGRVYYQQSELIEWVESKKVEMI